MNVYGTRLEENKLNNRKHGTKKDSDILVVVFNKTNIRNNEMCL
jgi:hypothetical protein